MSIWFVRHLFLKWKLRLLRPQVKLQYLAKIGLGTTFSKGRDIVIGRDFFCGRDCHFAAPAEIGNDVLFASFVSLVGGDHRIDEIDGPIRLSGRDEMKTIVIEDDVWVGHGAIILHGCRLGRGCVVGAGAVVTRDVPPFSIVAGNPAKLIRKRTR